MVDFVFYKNMVENDITNQILQFEETGFCSIFFNLLRVAENDNFLCTCSCIPLLNVHLFWDGP